MYRLDKVKEAAQKIQEISEGSVIDPGLKTNNIPDPINDGIREFNKGAEFGFPHQSHHIVESEDKPHKSGSYRPETTDDDVEKPAFIKKEVEEGREKRAQEGEKLDAMEKATIAQANKLGIEPIEYRRLAFIKYRKPEKLEKYKVARKLQYIEDADILSPHELLRK